MAPELEYGGGPTAAGDVYAFGLIIYEVLTRSCLAHLSDSDSDRSTCRTPDSGRSTCPAPLPKSALPKSAFGFSRALRSAARSLPLSTFGNFKVSTGPTGQAVYLPDPAGASAEVVGLMHECLRVEPEQRPPFQELDRRLEVLDVALMTSAAFAKDVECAASPLLSAGRSPQRAAELHADEGPVIQGRSSHAIMHSLFPPHVVEALIMGLPVPPEPKELVTVFFSDIVGFTTLSSTLDPGQVQQLVVKG